ncbi:hypothetical protein [Actinokineospora diospyrosa]|uniref:hypothetical protein n=1 Tax=Actinokineospora diospyrosa TaxID=103728 RepID=UPI0020A34095|nr:hypothetical protein [Actinokineospora diospyrosa]
MTVETLFSGGHLDAHLVDLQRQITQHLNTQGYKSMLATPEPETVARLPRWCH